MKRNTPVPGAERIPQRSGGFSWDELRYFLAVCEHGSFRAAASVIGVSLNQVRRKIEALEAELSTLLFVRSHSGATMTPDARSVYSIAIEIKERVGYLDNFAMRKSSAAEGLVRLTVTEGLGTFWITPKLTDFTTRLPRIRLELRCEMRVPDLSRLESDIAIQLEKPQDPDLICRKIATIHLILFGSRAYIEQFGAPEKFIDLPNHRLVHLVADQIPSHIVEERARFDPQLKFARIITNTSSAQAMAIADGVGVGALPTYAVALSERLVPISTEFRLSRPVWLVYNPEVANLKRVRAVIDWVTEAFDPKKYPWFRDEYIPPAEFTSGDSDFAFYKHALGWQQNLIEEGK